MKDEEFRKKIDRTRHIEREILKWIWENVDKSAHMPPTYRKEFDIVCKKLGDVEVKEDRLAHQTGNYAIEYQDAEGKSSGISLTTAQTYVLVDFEYVIFISVQALACLIDESHRKRIIEMGYTTKDGKRAKGYLISRKDIVYSPYANVLDRWFK